MKPYREGKIQNFQIFFVKIFKNFPPFSLVDKKVNYYFSVRIERHQESGRSVKTDFNITSRPEAKKPWVPASVNILNCENQKSKKRTKQTFGAVKHVD